MSTLYLSQSSSTAIDSAVLIGMGSSEAWPQNIDALAQIKVPVLDLYGSQDLDTVLTSTKRRAAAGKQNASGIHRQIKTDGANHFFQGQEAALVRQVIEWLETR